MTNQQAIKWIDRRILELACIVDITKTDAGMKRINEEYNALLLAGAALVKRTPTMVTHEATLHRCCTCPSCKQVVGKIEEFVPGQKILVITDWCQFCGQALKWEE